MCNRRRSLASLLLIMAVAVYFLFVAHKLYGNPSNLTDFFANRLKQVHLAGQDSEPYPTTVDKRKFFQETCAATSAPLKSIFYVKVHKTASTTLRSTLLVYGRTYNLTVCMDATDLWGLNWPNSIINARLTKAYFEKCDIVAEEVVYNQEKIQSLMADNPFILTSVRHPVQHFFSLYKYARVHEAVEKLIGDKLHIWDAIRIFLRHYKLVQNVLATYRQEDFRDHLQIDLVRPNLQLYSLGIQLDLAERMTTDDTTVITKRLDEFDFITVAERYDESMVILRDKLCCTIEDVVYRKQNVRRDSSEMHVEVPKDIEEGILQFNRGDLMMYETALARLQTDIAAYPQFSQAMDIYRFELKKYEEACLDNSIPEEEKVKLFPPNTNGQVGVFAEGIRAIQRNRLLDKLRAEYLTRTRDSEKQ